MQPAEPRPDPPFDRALRLVEQDGDLRIGITTEERQRDRVALDARKGGEEAADLGRVQVRDRRKLSVGGR